MIHALLILDPSGFPIFEYFAIKQNANVIIEQIELNVSTLSDYKHGVLTYHEVQFSEKFRLVLVFDDEIISEDVIETLPRIGINLMSGDKVTINQVLQATKMDHLGFLR